VLLAGADLSAATTFNASSATITATISKDGAPGDTITFQSPAGFSIAGTGDTLQLSSGGSTFASASGGANGTPLSVKFTRRVNSGILPLVLTNLVFQADSNSDKPREITITVMQADGQSLTLVSAVTIIPCPILARTNLLASENITRQVALAEVIPADLRQRYSIAFTDHSATGGVLGLAGDTFRYTPPTNFVGNDAIFYYAVDAGHRIGRGKIDATVLANGELVTTITTQNSTTAADPKAPQPIKLCGAGTPGQTVQVLGSSDLITWTLLSSATVSPDGILEFVDRTIDANGRRFYRTFIVP
jgi:hypothetical protein